MFVAIPAPPFNRLGPFHLYGLMIATGVLAAVWLGRKRWAAMGHDPDDISSLATWVVPAGLIGTRIYHVITDYNRLYCGAPKCTGSVFWDAFKVWNGGLGIPGGILAGVVVGVWRARKMGIDWRDLADAVVPGIPLAQAIGRFGNYFNQELYGGHTSLPWGLKVDDTYRPAADQGRTDVLYHPTFLYESLWNLALLALLLKLYSSGRLRRGAVLWVYVLGYSVGRLWVESLRIDTANHILGLRLNVWTSLIGIAIGVWGLYRLSQTEALPATAPGTGSSSAADTPDATDDAITQVDAHPVFDSPTSDELTIDNPDSGDSAEPAEPDDAASRDRT